MPVVSKDDLIAEAFAAACNAYAPYSNFGVGAAALLTDGSIVHGANFENASYGLSLCAETVAIAAVNMLGGMRHVASMAVVGGTIDRTGDGPVLTGSAVVRPCGRCRQILNEAAQLGGSGGRDIEIFCASADGAIVERHMLSDLLPHAFGPANLMRNLECP